MQVASFTDAWIETLLNLTFILPKEVASFTDAWIETEKKEEKNIGNDKSHLLQMRGLKQGAAYAKTLAESRIFYRCVD